MAHERAETSPHAAESEDFPATDPFQGISTTDKLSAAVQYTSAGLRIFPIEPNSKRPIRETHGFKDASNELCSLADQPGLEGLGWFDFMLPDGSALTVTPHENWALEPGPAGFTVIDIDPKNGGDKTWAALIDKHGPIVTREVSTPGGGRHLYCRGTVTAINKTLGPGIDTRCFGGYVMLPPSSIHGRYYDWVDPSVPIAPLPEWVREILETQARHTPGESYPDAADTERWRKAEWQEADGAGGDFDYRLSLIGDEAGGGQGFYGPMLSAAGYGVRIGMDLGEVVARIEEAALAAPRGKRSLSYVREKLAELRHHAIPKFRQRDQDKDQKAAAQEAEGAPKDAEPPAEPPVEEAIWRTKDEAAPFVDQAIQTWVDRAGVHIDELPPKLIALATPAGFGKTRRVLSKWARLQAGSNASLRRTLADLLKGSPVNLGKLSVAVPTHNLGIEFQDRVIPEISEEIGSLLEMPRLLGRRPETCQRYDVVRAAIEKGHAPKHVCRQVQPNGTEQVCPFFGKCSSTPGQYQYELARVRDARNSIITHKHLAITGMPELRLDKRKSQWIDEDPTGAFLQREQAKVKHIQALVTDHDFAELERHLALDGAKSAGTSRKGLKRLEAIRDVFLQQHATQAEPQLEDFAAWSSQELRTAASDRETIERWRRGKLNPTIPDAELTEQLAKAPAPKKLAGLLNRLADEMDARSAGPIYSYEWRGDKLVMRGRLPTTKLPPNILLTDATASPTILRAVFPGREIDFQQINIHRNAHITQVRDLTFSRYWLLSRGNLPFVINWLTGLTAQYPRLAIFTTKRIRCAITGEDRKGKLPPCALLPDTTARIGHYGNLKGSDQFKDCGAIVILGREQPNAADLEDAMKAMFYDTPEPLKFVTGDDYETVKRPYLMRDRSAQSVEVLVHPDPRGQALLEQCRECEEVQALDRGRLIHHEGLPKPVFILCSIPLPGVEVDRLVTWKELAGPSWLRSCLDEVAAVPLNALPLSAGWLATRFPEVFRSVKAAERALANDRVIEALEEQAVDYPHSPSIDILQGSGGNPSSVSSPWFPGWSLTRFRVAKKAGRSPSCALVRDGADPSTAIAEALGRDPSEIIIIASAATVTDLGVGVAEGPISRTATMEV